MNKIIYLDLNLKLCVGNNLTIKHLNGDIFALTKQN